MVLLTLKLDSLNKCFIKSRESGFVDENGRTLYMCGLNFWYPGQVRLDESYAEGEAGLLKKGGGASEGVLELGGAGDVHSQKPYDDANFAKIRSSSFYLEGK